MCIRDRDDDLSIADRLLEGCRGHVDCAVRKSLTHRRRTSTPGGHVPPSGPIPFMKRPSNGAADKSHSNNRYSHGPIMAGPRAVGNLVGVRMGNLRCAAATVGCGPKRPWADGPGSVNAP